jgi:hypothetical protein
MLLSILLLNCNSSDKSYRKESEQFIESIKVLQNASGMIEEMKEPNNTKLKEIANEMNKGIQLSQSVSDDFLNTLHPEMSFQYRNKLIKSQEIFIENINSSITNNEFNYNDNYEANILLAEYAEFENENKEEIFNRAFEIRKGSFTERLLTIPKVNMKQRSYFRMLIRYFISVILGGITIFISSAISMLLLIILNVIPKNKENTIAHIVLLNVTLIVIFIFQLFMWLLWSAYCSKTSIVFSSAPDVSYPFIYYVTGFIAVFIPVKYIVKSGQQKVDEGDRTTVKLLGSIIILTFISYILFCMKPILLNSDYFAWFISYFFSN